ncbi:hypothetical protein [Gloeothece verrucosa]|uniref:Uncharacterized protein n=1 Tax=Gloeothece verrucosa (strain PCC 7822) TaxID=497965 RepID=E0UMA1_GLOV7|nr:hypothetical protein [Gloeothece verrucosa]ADN18081.1 hypothetical protein Cyan7822_6281 [Gloeothece verrucosa PCC 7822]
MIQEIQIQEIKQQENRAASSFIFLAIALCLSVLVNLGLVWALIAANSKKTTFVQLQDGSAAIIAEQDANYREATVIQNTTKQFLTLLWEWSNKLPGSTEPDSGFEFVTGSKKNKIPSSVYYASGLVSGNLANALIEKIVDKVPQGVFSGQAESDIYIEWMSSPRKTGENLYEIDVIATVTVRQPGQLDEHTRLTKTFVWKAVDPYFPLTGDKNPSPIRHLLMSLRASGLLLVDAKEFNPNN